MRRLIALLQGLPQDSQLVAAQQGTTPAEVWTVERELMAQTLEVLSVVAAPKHALRKPVQVPRPSERRAAPTTVTEAAQRLIAGGRGLVVAR